jgi:hypothetical protein
VIRRAGADDGDRDETARHAEEGETGGPLAEDQPGADRNDGGDHRGGRSRDVHGPHGQRLVEQGDPDTGAHTGQCAPAQISCDRRLARQEEEERRDDRQAHGLGGRRDPL